MTDHTTQLPSNIDYSESMNVGRVHESVKREKEIGAPGKEPVPLWALLLFVPWFIIAGIFVGGYLDGGGPARKPAFDANLIPAPSGPLDPVKEGKRAYATYCASCHTPSGVGVPGQYPSLVDSEWVKDSDRRLAMIIKNGLSGPITVNGVSYNNLMPPQAPNMGAAAAKRIAYIMSYIRQEWNGGASLVTPEQVQIVLDEYKDKTDAFTVQDLEAIQGEDLMLPKVGSYEQDSPEEGDGGEAPAPAEGDPAAQ